MLWNILLLVIQFLVLWIAPLSASPDTPYYWGTALATAQGGFLSGLDYCYHPLLGWMMAPLFRLNLDPVESYRVVSFFCVAAMQIALYFWACLLQSTKLAYIGSSALLFLNLFYLAAIIVTGDLLAGTLLAWAWLCLLLRQKRGSFLHGILSGILGGLAYYAKPQMLPLYLASLCVAVFWPRLLDRRGRGVLLLAGLSAMLLATPYIVYQSKHFERLTISGQFEIFLGNLSLANYAPQANKNFYYKSSTSHTPSGFSREASSLYKILNHAKQGAEKFFTVTGNLLFTPAGLAIYLSVLFLSLVTALLDNHSIRKLTALFAASFILLHLFAWGPYLRYYFPVLIPCHLLAFTLLESAYFRAIVQRYFSSDLINKLRALLVLTVVLFAGFRTVSSVVVDISRPSRKDTLQAALRQSALVKHKGIVTGFVAEPLSSIIAYAVGRPYYGSIRESDLANTGLLQRKLDAMKVQSIFWLGQYPEELEKLRGWKKEAVISLASERLFLFEREVGDKP